MRPIIGTLVSALAAGAIAGAACGDSGTSGTTGSSGAGAGPSVRSGTNVSTSLALSADDATLYDVNQDSDSISAIDTATRQLVAEIPLRSAPPAVDPTTQRYEPAVTPRALALVDEAKVYVAGESSNSVLVVDAAKHAVIAEIPVPAAPVAVAAAPDGSAVYVVSHEAGIVSKIDPATDTVVGSVPVSQHPWAITVSADGTSLFVTHLLLEPGVTVIDAPTMTVRSKTAIADEPPGTDKRIPNGLARGLYAVVPRPSTGELWVPHLLLAVGTAQPDLDFESTVFPTITTLSPDGSAAARRLLFQPMAVPGAKGAFGDSVSGPRSIAFTPDGKLALVALSQSEDVMVFDADKGVEIGLVRPLPSALLEGIVVDHAGRRAFIDGRNTHDVTVLAIDPSNAIAPVKVDGAPIDRISSDPMPADLRRGQRLFHSANSAAFPITKNFWVACASCHIEGGSDAVTWKFAAGPRDTPSNAGGPVNTGFLMHQGLRNTVTQYDETIRIEQGGSYDATVPAQKADLDALAAYVNYAIPFPQNPHRAPGGALTPAQAKGKAAFDSHCSGCHTGAYYTDSGEGNASLDIDGTIMLHDVGTCVIGGPFPDQPADDVGGHTHSACDFDTPSLRGVFASPPYFHDGSAATLRDAIDRLSFADGLDEGTKNDLVEYLETL
jgi:YVTN family beta-propeller protein